MITQDSTVDVFDDAVHATAYMATAMLKRGELLLPQRIREHLADGPVTVHLVRDGDDVAVHEATLTSRSTLTGIEWPDDVKPRTSLTVMCPRGGASHDIGVLLPELEPEWADPEDADTPDIHGALLSSEPLAEPEPWCDEHGHPALRCTYCDTTGEIDESGPAPQPVTDGQLAAITGALTAFAAAALPADIKLEGPAEYAVPADDLPVADPWHTPWDTPWSWTRDEQPTETIAAVPAAEQTEIAPAFGAIEWPADEPSADELESLEVLDVDRDYRSWWRAALAWIVALAAIVASSPAWVLDQVAMRVRWSARWQEDNARTVAGLIIGVLSFLVLAGSGVLWLLLEVAR